MNKIYYRIPVLGQHLLTSLYGLKLKRERFNKKYYIYLKRYENEEIRTMDEIKNLLEHLKERIPKYRDIKIDYDNPIHTMKMLKITTKEELRSDLENCSDINNRDTIIKTGGTTGKSLKVFASKEDLAKRNAYLDYLKLRYGVKPFSNRASFTGKEITPEKHNNILWRTNKSINQVLYASFKLNKDNVKYVYEDMKSRKPVLIDGFPSAIHLVAKYILKNKIKINWEIKAIFPTAETLTEIMRKDIETAFNTTVVNQYASSEGAPFLYSDESDSYNICNETGFFEFYKTDENIYEMVVTSYMNYTTPIVRYKIGDCVQIDSKEAYLNNLENEILIKKILGRSNDYLLGDNHNKITSVNLANAIKAVGDKIVQAQFVQKKFNRILINLVVDQNFNTLDEKLLLEKLINRFGNNTEFKFVYLPEIPKEKSGKTRFIVNEVGTLK